MARMSQKEQLARLQAEKAAEQEEKAAKKAAKKTTKKKAAKKTTKKKAAKRTRKKSTRKSAKKVAARMRAQWTICDRSAKPVKTYAYRDKEVAYTECARLQESSGSAHFVRMEKIEMEPEPAPTDDSEE